MRKPGGVLLSSTPVSAGTSASGSAETVAAIRREHVVDFHATHVHPEGATVVVAGDLTGVDVDAAERTVTVEPGIINQDLKDALAPHGLSYPPDPGSVAISSIGGNVATNAGGLCCVRYGVTRDYVRRLREDPALADRVEAIKQNLIGAFGYNVLCIPIAAGVLYPMTGMLLSPIIAGAAMSLSSITVVSNANRLRLWKPTQQEAV